MKGKRFKKLTSLIVTAAMAVMMMTGVVSAAAGTTYTPVAGTTTTFDKYLIMPTDANVPGVTFSFSIAGGTAQTGDANTFAVYSGTDTTKTSGTPTIGTATFASGNTTFTSAQTGDVITLASGQKYAVQVVTVSFEDVTYKEPGVYRYTISETDPSVSGITPDTTPKTLDVYVQDDGSGTLQIGDGTTGSGYVLYNSVIDTAPSKTTADVSASKATGFINTYDTNNLTISKTVDGNQASRDEYFEFTITIADALPETTYNVDLSNADATTLTNGVNTAAHTNPATFTTDDSGAATLTYWLQDGQSIVLLGLTDGTKYTVTEDATTLADEGYTTEVVITGNDTDPTNNAPQVTDTTTGITEDTTLAYTNTKDGVIPTGIILSVAGLLVVGLIAVIGFVFFGIRSKRRYDED